jgi:hypothetical protein
MGRVLLLCCLFFISSCAVRPADVNLDGYVNPVPCGEAWYCKDDPRCGDDHYRFLCERGG